MLMQIKDFHAAVQHLATEKDVSNFDVFKFAYEWYHGRALTDGDVLRINSHFSFFLHNYDYTPHYVKAYCRAAHAVLET